MRTCTLMIYTHGATSRYAVMRGPLRGGRVFDSNKAEIVAVYEIVGQPDYRAMTAKHATPEAPAVYWQA
jgi:hypothetical protein